MFNELSKWQSLYFGRSLIKYDNGQSNINQMCTYCTVYMFTTLILIKCNEKSQQIKTINCFCEKYHNCTLRRQHSIVIVTMNFQMYLNCTFCMGRNERVYILHAQNILAGSIDEWHIIFYTFLRYSFQSVGHQFAHFWSLTKYI